MGRHVGEETLDIAPVLDVLFGDEFKHLRDNVLKHCRLIWLSESH